MADEFRRSIIADKIQDMINGSVSGENGVALASIAMAMCKDGLNRMGEWVYAHDQGKVTKVKIVSPIFYDKKGERRDG